MKSIRLLTLILLLSLMVGLVACGGDEEATQATIEPAATTAVVEAAPTEAPAPTVEPTAAGPLPAASFQDAVKATVQIEAQGSFMDPQFGMQLNSAGRGSGFIIDPSGIAVTNNHVVTGAAFLKVFVQGYSEPLNAKVLGVSECSDLAVIDIEGDGYPFVEWNTTPVSLGTEIYALGYPLGDPQPTLTRGVISKVQTSGETSWASVDHVLEHDATINPGNSGGPLVTTDGKVVGVNYAGASDVNQYFSISAADARSVVEQLRSGTDLDSIGINGEAVSTDDGSTTGIWVASVESGSPADKAGIRAGDVITSLEGLVLATDGSMADYCDILRSRNSTDTMSVSVWRTGTDETFEGQLNGRALELATSFAQQVDVPDSGGDTGGSGGDSGATYTNYVGIYDDSQAVYVEVPQEWTDVSGANWVGDDGTVLGSELKASTNIAGFEGDYVTPGVDIIASPGLGGSTMDELVDFYDYSTDCTYDGRFDYSDPVFTGRYDQYSNCAGQGSVIIVLAAEPADKTYAVIVEVQAVTEADLDALDHILNTFNVVGTLPGQ